VFAVATIGLKSLKVIGVTERSALRPRYADISRSGIAFMFTVLVATVIGTTSDLLVIGHYLTERDVAHYGFAAMLTTIVSMPFVAMATALAPILAGFQISDRKQTENQLRRMVGLIALPTVLLSIVIALCSKPLLEALAGSGYGPAWSVVCVLVAAECVFVATGPCGLALLMTGHEMAALLLAVAAAAASLGAGIWAAPRYGMIGVAVATSTVLALDNVIGVVLARRLTGILTLARMDRSDLRSLWWHLRALRPARVSRQ